MHFTYKYAKWTELNGGERTKNSTQSAKWLNQRTFIDFKNIKIWKKFVF